jgi:hypothetical protein
MRWHPTLTMAVLERRREGVLIWGFSFRAKPPGFRLLAKGADGARRLTRLQACEKRQNAHQAVLACFDPQWPSLILAVA